MGVTTPAEFHEAMYRGEIDACRVFLDHARSAGMAERDWLTLHADWLRRAGRMEESLAACIEITERFPGWDGPRYTLADVASHLGRVDEGVLGVERIAPAFVPEVGNQIRAEAWYAMGRDSEVVALRPEQTAPRSSNYLTRLQAAQSVMRARGIQAGIAEFARAWTTPDAWQALGYLDESAGQSLWWGQCAPPRRLRVARRGGIGDDIQWSRYAAALQAQGVAVTYELSLAPELRPAPGRPSWTGLYDGLEPPPREEMWADPFALFTAMFPRIGYGLPHSPRQAPASAPATEIAARARKAARGRPCVALFWSANESHGNFALKSACLPHVLPLLAMTDVHWVVVQRGHQMRLWLEQEDHASATNVVQPLTVDDTAALLAQLDAAVVVDTAVAHLAGALGVPTFILLGGAACWRWESFDHATPWYDSVRLIRQPALGDWDGAVTRAMHALRDQVLQAGPKSESNSRV